MTDLEQYLKWKKRLDELKKEEGRLEGTKQLIENQLREDFECNTIDEAKALLTKKQKEMEQKKQLAKEILERLEEQWSEKLS